jgi:hypothetical protein
MWQTRKQDARANLGVKEGMRPKGIARYDGPIFRAINDGYDKTAAKLRQCGLAAAFVGAQDQLGIRGSLVTIQSCRHFFAVKQQPVEEAA